MLTDNHGRPVNYLRLAVTDRCNLRCMYCMPEQGLDWVPRNQLLSFEEIMRVLRISSKLGITKLRITGGEPFLRKDIMDLFRSISSEELFETVTLTTNGTRTAEHLPELKRLGIHSVNLSLDTFDEQRFIRMTRRNDFSAVMKTFEQLLKFEIPTKINAVILENENEEDIYALSLLARDYPVAVRFIEEMPFNGKGDRHAVKWTWTSLLSELQRYFPSIEKTASPPFSTSMDFKVPGHSGTLGIIAAYSRTFCGTCNRIRITPKGNLKTCLYDGGVLNVRDLLRTGASDDIVSTELLRALGKRALNGFEAEKKPVNESMAEIGG